MKKVIIDTIKIFLIINAIAISIAHAQEMHDEKLNGKVKTVTIYTYQSMSGNTQTNSNYLTSKSIQKYNDKGRIIEYTKYRRTGRVEYIDTYTYNEKGFLVSTNSIDNLEGSESEKEEFKYDSIGNQIEIKLFNAANKQTSLSKLKYNGKKLVEENIYKGQSDTPSIRRFYIFDANGHNIAFKLYKENHLEVSNTYTFDSKDSTADYINRDGHDKVIETGSYIYKYYPTGSVKEKLSITNGNPSFKTIYDLRGNPIQEINYGGSGPKDIMSDETDKYDKIDTHGNWTIQSRYNSKLKTRIDIREIEYYQ